MGKGCPQAVDLVRRWVHNEYQYPPSKEVFPMPFVHVEWKEGRSLDQKRELVKRITEVVAEVGNVPPEKVHVFIKDMKGDEYAVSGVLTVDSNK
jgi:4-oxalocrotonate tautomerase